MSGRGKTMGEPIQGSDEELLKETGDTRPDPDKNSKKEGDTKPDPDVQKGMTLADVEAKIKKSGDAPG